MHFAHDGHLVIEVMMTKLLEDLKSIKHLTNLVRDEKSPDWWNQHDYSSGYFSGRQEAARLFSTYLDRIIECLETEKQEQR